mmetsp:Transcript_7829/g.22296  ORF Transcript_7829/g.22296 Transcript_7829/m.22296 type:complete len:350 (+) Transcript_7829:224-1273(+)
MTRSAIACVAIGVGTKGNMAESVSGNTRRSGVRAHREQGEAAGPPARSLSRNGQQPEQQRRGNDTMPAELAATGHDDTAATAAEASSQSETRQQRAQFASARMAETRRPQQHVPAGLSLAQETGQRRRREAEEQQQRLVEQMARIYEATRDEESLGGQFRGASVRERRLSSTNAPRQRQRSRSSRSTELEEEMSHGVEDYLEMPPWALPGRSEPQQATVLPGPDAGIGGLVFGHGGGHPGGLLEMLLSSRNRFLEQDEEMQMAMALSLSMEDSGIPPEGSSLHAEPPVSNWLLTWALPMTPVTELCLSGNACTAPTIHDLHFSQPDWSPWVCSKSQNVQEYFLHLRSAV